MSQIVFFIKERLDIDTSLIPFLPDSFHPKQNNFNEIYQIKDSGWNQTTWKTFIL